MQQPFGCFANTIIGSSKTAEPYNTSPPPAAEPLLKEKPFITTKYVCKKTSTIQFLCEIVAKKFISQKIEL